MVVVRRSDALRRALRALPLGDPHALVRDPDTGTAAVFELEQRFVLARSWNLVALRSALDAAGTFVATTAGSEPVVVVRGRDEHVRALGNVCTHRASLLVEGAGHCGRTLVCPYHGWTFGLDGRLLGVPHRTGFDDIDRGTLGLATFAVGTWGPFFFVDPSGGAEPLPPDLPASAPTDWAADAVDAVERPWKSVYVGDLRDRAERVAATFAACTVFVEGGRLVARRYEPLTPRLTTVHTFVGPRADGLDGVAPSVALDRWSGGYASALVALLGSDPIERSRCST